MIVGLPELLAGAWVTAQIAVGGILLAAVVGLIIGLATASTRWWLRLPARYYVELFRGTSVLVQLFWIFYVLPLLFDIRLSGMMSSILAMGLMVSAYLAEVVRSALLGVPSGQREAAKALGLGPLQTLWRVVLPQAVPAMLPPWGNLVIELTKLSAVAMFVSLPDLMNAGNIQRALRPDDGLLIYALVGICYGLICLAVVAPVKFLERVSVQRLLGRLLLDLARIIATPLRLTASWWLHCSEQTRDYLLRGGYVLLACLVVFASFSVVLIAGRQLVELWDMSFALRMMPLLLDGLRTTAWITLWGSVIALLVGLIFAALVSVRFIGRPLQWAMEAIRSTPILVQLYLIYYGLFPFIGLRNVDPILVGIIGLGVHYATYCAEVYRAGIAGVPHGQREAAKALGLTRAQIFVRIILPQAVPRSLPALGNYVIAMFKETPWLSAITVQELLFKAQHIQSTHYRSLEAFTMVGLLFLLLSLSAALIVRLSERLFPVRHA